MNPDDHIEVEAAEWLARHEGVELGAADRAAFAAWCAADPRHRAAFERLAGAWQRLDQLRFYPREPGLPADPEFFAPRSRRPRRMALALATAAAFLLGGLLWLWSVRTPVARHDAVATASAAPSQFMRLPDGSEVELKAGSRILEKFTPAERRIVLARGEAHFVVQKNPARPFVVDAGDVAVRAVGTAFNVRLGGSRVEVLVTEGRVRVGTPRQRTALAQAPEVAAGQRVIVATSGAADSPPMVESLTPSQIDGLLAWQSSRLRLDNTPLEEVVARFNAVADVRGGPRLRLGDAAVGKIRISGRIRADNVAAFVELLEFGFGVSAEQHGDEVLLYGAPAR